MKSETIDAVAFVRKIRDANYEELREMTAQERIEFYRKKAQKVQKQIDQLLSENEEVQAPIA